MPNIQKNAVIQETSQEDELRNIRDMNSALSKQLQEVYTSHTIQQQKIKVLHEALARKTNECIEHEVAAALLQQQIEIMTRNSGGAEIESATLASRS